MPKPFYIEVEVLEWDGTPVRYYTMDHNDPAQRKVLGIQCRNAFEGGQQVWTCPQRNPLTGERD